MNIKEWFLSNIKIKIELWSVTTGIFGVGLFTGLIMRITEQRRYLFLAGVIVWVLKQYLNKIFIDYKNEKIQTKRRIQRKIK